MFSELCITGYTCQDLFFQNALLDKAMEGVVKIAKTTADSDMLVAVGVPVRANGKLYNCAAVIQDGEVRAFVPKTHLPNYNEFYEARHFAPYRGECAAIDLREYGQFEFIPPMEQTVFVCEEIPELVVGFELCEDLWVADPVSNYLAKAGATLICNCLQAMKLSARTHTADSLYRTSPQGLWQGISIVLQVTASQRRIWSFQVTISLRKRLYTCREQAF